MKKIFSLIAVGSLTAFSTAQAVDLWVEDFEGANVGDKNTGANSLITNTSVYVKNYNFGGTNGFAVVEENIAGFTGNTTGKVLALYATASGFEALTPGANGTTLSLGQTFAASDTYTFSFDIYLPADIAGLNIGELEHRWRSGASGNNVEDPNDTAYTTAGVYNISYSGLISDVSDQTSVDGIAHFIRIWEDQWDGIGTAPLIGYVDNISLTVVPEPGTYALVAGALALGSVMIRRRRA